MTSRIALLCVTQGGLTTGCASVSRLVARDFRILVPRLRLGTHCLAGSAGRKRGRVQDLAGILRGRNIRERNFSYSCPVMFLPTLQVFEAECPPRPRLLGVVHDVGKALSGERSTRNCRFWQKWGKVMGAKECRAAACNARSFPCQHSLASIPGSIPLPRRGPLLGNASSPCYNPSGFARGALRSRGKRPFLIYSFLIAGPAGLLFGQRGGVP